MSLRLYVRHVVIICKHLTADVNPFIDEAWMLQNTKDLDVFGGQVDTAWGQI